MYIKLPMDLWLIITWANWEGIGPWKSRLFWAPNSTRLMARCHFTGPKKVSISRTQPPPTCPLNGFAHIKSNTYIRDRINNTVGPYSYFSLGHVINMSEKACILELGGAMQQSPESEPGLRLLRDSPQGSAEVISFFWSMRRVCKASLTFCRTACRAVQRLVLLLGLCAEFGKRTRPASAARQPAGQRWGKLDQCAELGMRDRPALLQDSPQGSAEVSSFVGSLRRVRKANPACVCCETARRAVLRSGLLLGQLAEIGKPAWPAARQLAGQRWGQFFCWVYTQSSESEPVLLQDSLQCSTEVSSFVGSMGRVWTASLACCETAR